MSNIHSKDEYDDFKNQIRNLNVKELILLYVESRKGSLENREWIPLHLIFAIGKIETSIQSCYGTKMKKGDPFYLGELTDISI